ncbi:hypothetical protein F2Q68_00006089 [Brassica cretica]|uniref:Uncharacterized protein n=2 Tax=Brassica cretica TaxID=69181 RepID=A0ABQ7BY07_BRACR|nr:hypothetical protein F2Q68_00006089 [Brassica cretica]KAF3544505.1 hypothetical protein DY000_02009381 [Brassica cretica]
MNRGSTPKPKQDAEPHPQLSLMPPSTVATTACPNEETEGKTCFQTSRADIETTGYKIYEIDLRNPKNRLHRNQAQHLPRHDSNTSKLAFWPVTPHKQRQSRTEPPEAEPKEKQIGMNRSR